MDREIGSLSRPNEHGFFGAFDAPLAQVQTAGAVDRTGIDIDEAERGRAPRRAGGLTGSGTAVDGDDPVRLPALRSFLGSAHGATPVNRRRAAGNPGSLASIISIDASLSNSPRRAR